MAKTSAEIPNTEICFDFATAGHAQMLMMPGEITASWTRSECRKFKLPSGEHTLAVSGHSAGGVVISVYVNGRLTEKRAYPPGLFNGDPMCISITGGYYVS